MKKRIFFILLLAVVLASCDKNDRRSDDSGCICISRDIEGRLLGLCETDAEMLEDRTFIMFSNPTDDLFILEFKTPDSHLVTIKNKYGKELLRQSAQGRVILDIRDYSFDTYRVTVDDGKQKSTLC